MSVSYGIKPNWAVVLSTKENIQRLAYHLDVVEGAIAIFTNPQYYWYMHDYQTQRAKARILPILNGNTWNEEANREMTEEEARKVGYLVYPLGHHNWYTFLHRNNFKTYVTDHNPNDMKFAARTTKWVCPLSFKEHKMHDCNAKLFT